MPNNFVAQSLVDYGDELRQDWSDFDGRSARDELHSLASYLTCEDPTENAVRQALIEYGSALRGDWSDFDGRTAKAILHDFAAELVGDREAHTIEQHREELGLCPDGNGHWGGRWGYCQADTCPTFASEQQPTHG